MSIWSDLLAAIEAKAIAEGYTGTLAEVGIDQPYSAKLVTLLELRSKFAASELAGPPPKVKELTSALITRAANTTSYSIGDSYGGRGVFTDVGSIGQSLFINDFQVIIDITAIPASMALSVRFFTTEADTQVTGAPVSDNSLLTATLRNTATPADGYPLTVTVIGDKVFAVAKNIKFITPLEATSLWFYLRCNVVFTPAANSETMTAKASCEVY